MSYYNKGSMPTTVTISRLPDRSGNFVCDGTADDVEIQAAIDYVEAISDTVYAGGVAGGHIYLKRGEYSITTGLIVTGQNIHVEGAGWSTPIPGWANVVFLGLPLTTLVPSAGISINSWVITFNNTTVMISGCSFRNIAIDGRTASAVGNVGGVHTGNAVGFIFDCVTIMSVTGSCVLCDQAGSEYATPSISQLFFSNFMFAAGGRDGIEFGDNIFTTDVYITTFFISNLSRHAIHCGTGTGFSRLYIFDGTAETCTEGLHLTTRETLVHNVTVSSCWDHGIYIKNTPSWYYISIISHCICRDNDRNVNGSSQIIIDTDSYNYHLMGNICERQDAGGEIGINCVPGNGVNGNVVYQSNFCIGHTVTNFRIAGSNWNFKRYPPTTETVPFVYFGGGSAGWIVPNLTAGPAGIDIDADNEFAFVNYVLPDNVEEVVSVTIYGYSNVIEAANNMCLRVNIFAGGSGEQWNNLLINCEFCKSVETGGIVVDDVIHWVVDATVHGDIANLVAGELMQIFGAGEIADAPDIATDALLVAVKIEYIPI